MKKLLHDWRSVSQYVLVSSTLVGLVTRYYFLSECCCLKFAVLFLLGALSDERTGLYPSYFTTNGQSVSMSWYRAPLWDLRPDITSCRNVAVWNLRSSFCVEPSLTRERVCNLQCNHSMNEWMNDRMNEWMNEWMGFLVVFLSSRNFMNGIFNYHATGVFHTFWNVLFTLSIIWRCIIWITVTFYEQTNLVMTFVYRAITQ
jgi:hypothetical protein